MSITSPLPARIYTRIDHTLRMLAFFVPAGVENLFEDLLKLTAAGTWDMDSIVAVSAKHGIEAVSPLPEG